MKSYLGHWQLVPELCIYQQGEPPASGLYEIAEDGEQIVISIKWETAAGETQSASFAGPPTGEQLPIEAPGVSHLSISHVDELTLDSAAYLDGKEIMYARRAVSSQGDLLSTVQTLHGEAGSVSNFQVYRRIQ